MSILLHCAVKLAYIYKCQLLAVFEVDELSARKRSQLIRKTQHKTNIFAYDLGLI